MQTKQIFVSYFEYKHANQVFLTFFNWISMQDN